MRVFLVASSDTPIRVEKLFAFLRRDAERTGDEIVLHIPDYPLHELGRDDDPACADRLRALVSEVKNARPDAVLFGIGKGHPDPLPSLHHAFRIATSAVYSVTTEPHEPFIFLDPVLDERTVLPPSAAVAAKGVMRLLAPSGLGVDQRHRQTLKDGLKEADLIVRTCAYLRSAARATPEVTSALRTGASQREGALESIRDGEVIDGEKLWIKGWIAWDDSEDARLIATIGHREVALDVSGFRHDRIASTAKGLPTAFAGSLETDHLTSVGNLRLWIERGSGPRQLWLTRTLWISRPTDRAPETPVITGAAKILDGRLTASPNIEDSGEMRMMAWQSGRLIGAWTGAAPFDVPVRVAPEGLIHIHIGGDGLPAVPWVTLDPTTGEPPAAQVFDATSLSKGRAFKTEDASQIRWPNRPFSLYLDGRPLGRFTERPVAPIDLVGCGGQAILEIAGESGARTAIRILRVLRNAALGEALPAIVIPQASHSPATATAKPRVLIIRRSHAPTDELYLLAGLKDRAERDEIDLAIHNLSDDSLGPEERRALLQDGTTVIVSRYLTDAWISCLAEAQGRLGGIYYLIDDDVTLAERDHDMPPSYRRNMIGVAHGEFQAMAHLSTGIIATSEFLADRYASDKTHLVPPPYIRRCRSMGHLDNASVFKIEYHGTAVHYEDLNFVSQALADVHDTYPHVRIRVFVGLAIPPALRGLDRVECVPNMTWPNYCKMVARSRAHLAIAPMLGTPYNRGKSYVKVMDIARLGAAGLYSDIAPFNRVVTHNHDGLLLENDGAIWRDALAWMIEHPEETARIAHAGQDLARRLSDAHHPSHFWDAQLFGKTQDARP